MHDDIVPHDTPGTAGAPDEDGPRADDPTPPDGAPTRRTARMRVGLGTVLLTVLVLVSTAIAAGLYFVQYRPDADTDAAAAQAARQAATDGATALLSYAPDTLDRDFAAAESRLTGDFLTYYTQFTDQIVGPAAREKSVKTTAEVVRAAVSELQDDTAKVVIFTNQTTTSADKPDPTITASSVVVSLTKVDGAWLISSFDPV